MENRPRASVVATTGPVGAALMDFGHDRRAAGVQHQPGDAARTLRPPS